MLTADIRQKFLTFFQQNGHEIVPSSPIVPQNDPTLMFTNAGMVPFKNIFTGLETSPYTQATSAQKCVRAGGKHNDLENVGYTARHHTFFEMLGNFSFGDYFKEHAIELAWKLLTTEFQLDPKRLLITYYAEDDITPKLWKKISGLPDAQLISIKTNDNFWSMGATGPCGPCSEIFYDHGPDVMGGPPGSPNEDGDRFVELWNLVFMQYEQRDAAAGGGRIDLPKPSIDTGMGIERMAAVLQNTFDNYDTDIFKSLIGTAASITHIDPNGAHAVSLRVIADHIRSSCFIMAEGILPSNEGRGYVLRRIMRRAMRHAHLTGYKDLLLHQLVPILLEKMGQAYPELLRAKPLMVETLYYEEKRFKETLERGLRLLGAETSKLKSGGQFPGDVAFKLYDTYGFPLDLTQDALRAQGVDVEIDSFHQAMAEQKTKARAAWSGSGQAQSAPIWFDIKDRLPATEFLGYQVDTAEGEVVGMIKDTAEISHAGPGEDVMILTNQTPFYAASGGQVGDTGEMFKAGFAGDVTDTVKRMDNLYVHVVKIQKGSLKVGDVVELLVDKKRKNHLRANHSATHLLHSALRERFGQAVTQKGSLVHPKRLRFDFSLPKAMTSEDIAAVESLVNDKIRENTVARTKVMDVDQAIEAGAVALFGEKYGSEVRVVSMGKDDVPFSVELCGGTHVKATGDIGFFKIVSEGSVSAGVRRLEAVTGRTAEDWTRAQEKILQELCAKLKTAPESLAQKTTQLIQNSKSLEKALVLAKQEGAAAAQDEMKETIQGTALWVRQLKDVESKELRPMMDKLKQEIKSGVILILAENSGKVSAVLGVTGDLKETYPANALIKDIATALGAKGGGGRPDLAQCGGSNPDGIKDAITALKDALV